jgi:hypothetical protein
MALEWKLPELTATGSRVHVRPPSRDRTGPDRTAHNLLSMT